jgi:hypothetical protein
VNNILLMTAHAESCVAFVRPRPAGFVRLAPSLIEGQGTTLSGAALRGTAIAVGDAPVFGDDSALATFDKTTDVAHSVPWRPPV